MVFSSSRCSGLYLGDELLLVVRQLNVGLSHRERSHVASFAIRACFLRSRTGLLHTALTARGVRK